MDYDGTRSSNSEGSVNYSIQEYVNDSISTLVDVSDKNGIPPEYHNGEWTRIDGTIILFLSLRYLKPPHCPNGMTRRKLLRDAYELAGVIWNLGFAEPEQDVGSMATMRFVDQGRKHWTCSVMESWILKTRAQIERLYWSIAREINQIAAGLKHAPDEFRGLSKLLAVINHFL